MKRFNNTKIPVFILLFLFCFTLVKQSRAQVNVVANQTANALAMKLVGNGVQVFNATLVCPTNANGIFTVVTSNLGLDSGIVLTSGQAATVGATQGINGPNTGAGPSAANGAPGDADLNTVLSNITTFDACKLEFDFLPAGDTVKFDYIFASTEYQSYSCSSFNDVFGFFISGPGITGNVNIAKIPGTTIPITVNSTTGVPTNPGPLCTGMGPGSPFSQYYVNNAAGATITYRGFTTIFTAIAAVTPCSTYHLKLAIADASDGILDSGVFLKAGSLTSNAVSVTPQGGGGLTAPVPYCVRGCLPGHFVFNRPVATNNPLTIHYQIAGTAVNGVDYSTISDSVVIPAGQTSTMLNIFGLPANPPTGPVSVKLRIFSPYTCSTPVIIDSAVLFIYDSIYVNIITPDTAVCKYTSVDLVAQGDTLLAYSWTPAIWIDSPLSATPTVTPQQTTTYTVAATIPNSGCPPAHDHITVTIKEEPDVNLGPDVTTCLGVPIQFNATVTPTTQSYIYTWSPGTNLSSTTIANPIATPTADITYVLEADPGVGAGCKGYDTVFVHILPNDIFLYNHDTAICKGNVVQINALGDPEFTYTWTPSLGVSDTAIINPIISPDTTQKYTLTASFPSCPNIVKTINIDVQPNPQVWVGPDREKCQWDTIHIQGIVSPNYPFYSYSWTPAGGIDFPTKPNIVFSGQANVMPLTLTVTTPAGCVGFDDLDITVHKGNFATLSPTDTGICPRDSVHLRVTGGVLFDWTSGLYLTDSTVQSPVAFPVTSINYSLLTTDQFGCLDTLLAHITVHPDAVLDLGEDVELYPGESVQMDPKGNGLYFQWFPPLGLSATNIANPIAQPDVNTRYFVRASTEWGCRTIDSVDIIVNNESVLDVPNAFTPGNNLNGEIKIVRRGVATLKYFRIFNRWGTKVFETTDIDKGWNGQLNGEPQPMGVYVYTVEAVTNTGKRFIKQGNITLIR